MNTPASGPLTIGVGYPWLSMTLDQTDKIVTIIPEDRLDWRLSDPSGKWHFSLAEIAHALRRRAAAVRENAERLGPNRRLPFTRSGRERRLAFPRL